VGLRDADDDRVLKGAGVPAVAVEGDAADGRPRLVEDAVLDVKVLDLALLEVGVDLHLVHRRGTTSVASSSARRWSIMKLLHPVFLMGDARRQAGETGACNLG